MKAVIFDLDGVLVDSFDVWYHATKKVLESIGQSISRKEYQKYWGISFEEAIGDWNLDLNEKEKQKLEQEHNKFFEQNLNKVKTKPYAKQIIQKLKEKGIKLSIVSNSPKKVINNILNRFNMNFDVVMGNDKFNKPSPKGINTVLEILDVNKEDAIYIGDTKIDRETGQNANIKTLIIGKDIEDLRELIHLANG